MSKAQGEHKKGQRARVGREVMITLPAGATITREEKEQKVEHFMQLQESPLERAVAKGMYEGARPIASQLCGCRPAAA